MQIREGDPTRFIDKAKTAPAIGQTVGVYGRPGSWGGRARKHKSGQDHRSKPTLQYLLPDLYNSHDTQQDEAHVPDPFFVPYILTGDPYYLDGLELWAGSADSTLNPDCGPGIVAAGRRIISAVRGAMSAAAQPPARMGGGA